MVQEMPPHPVQIDIRSTRDGRLNRGFHVHEKGDCGPAMKDGKMTAGEAAGPHFDPEGQKSHKGPKGAGHKGDLPLLKGTEKGILQTVTAPRLKLADVQGRALVIHEGGDNYSDNPENGGGKGRVACGVIPSRRCSYQARSRGYAEQESRHLPPRESGPRTGSNVRSE